MAALTKEKILYAVAFLDLFACSAVVPVLPPYLRSIGASHLTIGILTSLYFGLQLISSPVIGSWSKSRSHHFALQITLLVCSSFYFIQGTSKILPFIFLSRAALGLFKHTQTICGTMLAEVVPKDRQLEIQKTMVSVGSLGFVTGPAIVGNMLEIQNGYLYVCYTVAIIFLINFAITCFLLPKTPFTSKKEKQDSKVEQSSSNSGTSSNRKHNKSKALARETKEVTTTSQTLLEGILQPVRNLTHINWSLYWDVLALKFFFDFTLAVHLQNFAPTLKDVYSTEPRWIGYTIALQGLAGAIFGILTPWVSKFYKYDTNYTRRTFHGFGIFTLSFFFLSLAPNWFYVFISLLPLSASISLLRNSTTDIIKQRSINDKAGLASESGQDIFSVARLFAPLCTGLIYDMYGFHGTSILKLTVAGIATAIASSLSTQQIQKKKKQ